MGIDICGVQFILMHQKALYRADKRLLIIADVHLGKAHHFRKGGVAIPAHAQQPDYDNLVQLINDIVPEQVYFLGDLFHSTFNRDWHNFCDLVARFPSVRFTLVKGNHDIIDTKLFKDICITVEDSIEDGPFLFTHEPMKEIPEDKLNIVGHIHPGVVLSGMARQSVKLPCFYLTPHLLVLPAFGNLTGLYTMDRTPQAKIFAVLPGSVKRVV